jgi:Rrf2 family protein
MVSQTTRYALLILGYLAGRQNGWVPGDQIARDTSIPANYLSKILNQLRKSGLVDSQKGWGGGFRLKPEAHAQPIQHVLEIFEGTSAQAVPACAFGYPECREDRPCPLHPYWQRIKESYAEMLRTMRVGELRERTPKD